MVQFKINNPNVIAALDIGTFAVRCAVAYREPSGYLKFLSHTQKDSQGFKQGRVVDFNSAMTSIGKVLESAEEASKTSFSELWISLNCPFQAFSSKGMAALPVREVRKKDMELAVETACAVPLPDHHTKLHSLPQMFSVDGSLPVLNPLGLSGLRLETRVHIVTAPEFYCRDLTKVLKALGCKVLGFIHNVIAFSEASVPADQKREGVCFCDIGCDATQAVVYKGGEIVTMFEIPIGGNDFSKALAHQFKIPFHEAEALKIQYGKFFSRLIGEEEQIELNGQDLFLSYKSFSETLEKTARILFQSLKEHLQGRGLLEELKAGFLFTGQTTFSPGFLNLASLELGESFLRNMQNGSPDDFQKKNTFSIIQQADQMERMHILKAPTGSRWAKLKELF